MLLAPVCSHHTDRRRAQPEKSASKKVRALCRPFLSGSSFLAEFLDDQTARMSPDIGGPGSEKTRGVPYGGMAAFDEQTLYRCCSRYRCK